MGAITKVVCMEFLISNWWLWYFMHVWQHYLCRSLNVVTFTDSFLPFSKHRYALEMCASCLPFDVASSLQKFQNIACTVMCLVKGVPNGFSGCSVHALPR